MTYNDVLSVGMCPKMRPVGVSKKGKKGQKLSCVKLAICPDHTRWRRPLKFCVRGRVREVVIYFKFHGNRSRGHRAVGGRKSPSPIDLAHGLYNSLYYRTSRDYTLARQCESVLKADEESQWKKPKFDISLHQTRWPIFWKIDRRDRRVDGTRHAKFCSHRFRGFCSPNTWLCRVLGVTSFCSFFGFFN